jgi:hypothetical protein
MPSRHAQATTEPPANRLRTGSRSSHKMPSSIADGSLAQQWSYLACDASAPHSSVDPRMFRLSAIRIPEFDSDQRSWTRRCRGTMRRGTGRASRQHGHYDRAEFAACRRSMPQVRNWLICSNPRALPLQICPRWRGAHRVRPQSRRTVLGAEKRS